MGIGFNALGDEPITLESMSRLKAAYDPQVAMQRKLAMLQGGQGSAAGMDMSQFLNTTSQAPVVVDDAFNVQGSGIMGTAVAGLNAMANAGIAGDIRSQKKAQAAQQQGVIDEQRNYQRAFGERSFGMEQDKQALEQDKFGLTKDQFGLSKDQFAESQKQFGMNFGLEKEKAATQKIQALASADAARASAAASRLNARINQTEFGQRQSDRKMMDYGAQLGMDMATKLPLINGRAPSQREVLIAIKQKMNQSGATPSQIQAAVAGFQAADADMGMLDAGDQVKIAGMQKEAEAANSESKRALDYDLSKADAQYANIGRVKAMNQQFDVKNEGEMWDGIRKLGITESRIMGGGDINDIKRRVASWQAERTLAGKPGYAPAVIMSAIAAAETGGKKDSDMVGSRYHIDDMYQLKQDIIDRQSDVDNYAQSTLLQQIAINKAHKAFNEKVTTTNSAVLAEQRRLADLARKQSRAAYASNPLKPVKPPK